MLQIHSEYVTLILLFHGENGYANASQCHVIRTLPVLCRFIATSQNSFAYGVAVWPLMEWLSDRWWSGCLTANAHTRFGFLKTFGCIYWLIYLIFCYYSFGKLKFSFTVVVLHRRSAAPAQRGAVLCRAVTWGADLRLLTAQTRVQFQDNSYAIFGGQSE
jgi:hypothetical protein